MPHWWKSHVAAQIILDGAYLSLHDSKKVRKCGQEIPQPQTVDKSVASRGRATQ